MDRDVARAQHRDLALVDVEAEHVVADVGQARAGDEPHVSGADDADLHLCNSGEIEARIDSSTAAGSAARVTERPTTR